DVLERLAPRLFPGRRMHRAQSARINDELLRFRTEAERLEQLCGVRVRRRLENRARRDDEGRTLRGIYRLDGLPRLFELNDQVLGRVRRNRTLTERELSRRIDGPLDLQYALLCELLEIAPPEISLHLIGCGHDISAEGRMRL